MTRDHLLALFVRTDAGGLASQSQQMVDLLRPDKIVCVDMGKHGRGTHRPASDFDFDAHVLEAAPHEPGSMRAVVDFLRGGGVLWSAETLYWLGLPHKLDRFGVKMRVHANVELLQRHDPEVSYALPTAWEQQRVGLPVVRHPAPVGDPVFDSLAQENAAKTGPVKRVLHMAAPAMCDRNGTEVMVRACEKYEGPPFTLVVAGSWTGAKTAFQQSLDTAVHLPDRIGVVTVERRGEVADRRDLYRDVDMLVIPRRYGGQSLPALEAAAAGLPVVMPDLSPQDEWEGVTTFRCLNASRGVQMRGGRFHVHQPDAQALSVLLEHFTSDEVARPLWSAKARAWAESLAWEQVEPEWSAWLDPARPPVPPRRQVEERRAPRRVAATRRKVGPPYRT